MAAFSNYPTRLLDSLGVLPASLPEPRFAMQPEKRLLLAMLEDAITAARRPAGKPRRRPQAPRVEARRWIFSNDVRWPFSFVNVCGVLGIDPYYLRRGLIQSADRFGDEPVRPIRSRARLMSGSRTRVTSQRDLRAS